MNKNQKGFGLVEVILVLVIIFGIASIAFIVFSRSKPSSKGSPEKSSNQTASETQTNSSDICGVVSDATFESVKSYPTESTDPDAQVKSKLKFLPDNTFEYTESDAVYVGSYSCTNNEFKVVSDGTDYSTKFSNLSWDAAAGILKLGEDDYIEVPNMSSQ